MTKEERFREMKYGMMIHFGLYSLMGGEWKGRKGPQYAEWTECFLEIPNREMEGLAERFDPVGFDPDGICALAVKAGMKYIVITAKHHEGFALFDSSADSFNSMHSPCRRDLIGEMADSCRRYGLGLGLYYSQCIDWHEKNGGGYRVAQKGCAGPTWYNSWDWRDEERNYEECFRRKIVPQVTELLTNYGPLFSFWFDMPLDMSEEQSTELYELVRALQSGCLINSRLGNGRFDYVSFGDNEIPDTLPEKKDDTDKNDIWGDLWSPTGLYESAGTMNDSWGWNKTDDSWKSAETLAMNRLRLERLGANYLLNVGPDGSGRIPGEAVERLIEANEIYEKMKGCK